MPDVAAPTTVVPGTERLSPGSGLGARGSGELAAGRRDLATSGMDAMIVPGLLLLACAAASRRLAVAARGPLPGGRGAAA